MFKIMSLAAGVLLLSGCATQFYNASTAGPLLEQASRLSPSTLRTHASCQLGFAATGSTKADFVPGACAHSSTALYLYSWDSTKKQYRREVQLEFASLRSFSRAKLALYTQLQIPVDGGRIVFESKALNPFVQALQQSGVSEIPAGGYVMPNAPPTPTTIYIPVYVGG